MTLQEQIEIVKKDIETYRKLKEIKLRMWKEVELKALEEKLKKEQE